MHSITVVVPVYNSEQSLPLLVERLEPVLQSLTDTYQLIMINDGSRDGSWAVVEGLAAQHAWITGINLMRNFGQHNAVLCGVRAAMGDVIVTMDDDLQNPPEEIPKMVAKLDEGFDVVYGTPAKMQHGFNRNMASRVTKLLLRSSMGVKNAVDVNAFRVFRTQLRDAFAGYSSVYVSIDVLLSWGTAKFAAVEVQFDAREFGVSNYTFSKLVRHAVNMITGFSVLPLRVASILGLVFVLFGAGVLAYVLVGFVIYQGSVPGFTFVASSIAIFSGVQLLTLGVMGEYMARMYLRLMDRPSYVVRDQTEPPA